MSLVLPGQATHATNGSEHPKAPPEQQATYSTVPVTSVHSAG